jgi:hypothetical protein
MTEPVMNPRIRVTYEFTSFRGYHVDCDDLKQSVDHWIQFGMVDREATMTEIECVRLGFVDGDPDE